MRVLRFRVEMPDGRTMFVYGKDEAEARGRYRFPISKLDAAGYVEDGVLHCPLAEVLAVAGSIVEGRVAPGA
jgi:hypothetical protein